MTPFRSKASRPCIMREPKLQELLDDPIMALVMQRDGIEMTDLTDFLSTMRKRLIIKSWRCAA